MTQQNPALVEERAAAVESLNDQAKHLFDALGAFKSSADPEARKVSTCLR